MSTTAPSDVYYKARRTLVVASGVLLLSTLAGLEPDSTDGSATIFSFRVTSPDAIPLVLVVVVIYSVWQFYSSWFVQLQAARDYVVNRVDFVISLLIAFTSLFSWIYPVLWPLLEKELESIAFGFAVSAISGLVASISSMFAVNALKSASRRKVDRTEFAIEKLLTEGEWELVFNPKRREGGSKKITFSPDGSIVNGANKNEHSWRVSGSFLEILNDQRQVFSRFRFNDEAQSFEHTNDEDTLSLRSQKIRRLKSGAV